MVLNSSGIYLPAIHVSNLIASVKMLVLISSSANSLRWLHAIAYVQLRARFIDIVPCLFFCDELLVFCISTLPKGLAKLLCLKCSLCIWGQFRDLTSTEVSVGLFSYFQNIQHRPCQLGFV